MKTPTIGRSRAAKARKLNESISYCVAIIGITWEGTEGTYSYTFDHEPTAEEIKHKAGDFQAILDYDVKQLRTIRYSDGERRIVKNVRPWANGEESIDKYCDANGC